MTLAFEHKRGDSFDLAGQLLQSAGGPPVDLTGVAIRAHLRDGDALVAVLDAAVTDALQGKYSLAKAYADTESWPVKGLSLDVEFTWPGGKRRSTQTVLVRVLKDVTLP
ncbi:MAG: hypothetical protein AB1482_13020 [Pseudomonadota bacterium]